MSRKTFILLTMTSFLTFGCFKDYRVGFDFEETAIFSCDGRIGINGLSIEDEESYELVRITKNMDFKGSNRLFLRRENYGYKSDSSTFKFSPLSVYKVSVSFGHAFVDMKLETGADGKVIKVSSDKECLED